MEKENKTEILAEIFVGMKIFLNIALSMAFAFGVFVLYVVLFEKCIPFMDKILIFILSDVRSVSMKFVLEKYMKLFFFFGGFYIFERMVSYIYSILKKIKK